MTDVSDHHSGHGEPYGKRRQSMLPRDGDGMTSGPNIRRMSRMDARPSIQYGMARRMSHASRSSLTSGMKEYKLPTQYQNTFQMTPKEEERFQVKKAEDVIKSVLESFLGGEKYGPSVGNMSKQISEVVIGRIKELGFCHRFKLVCLVTIGQNKNQGIAVVSRSVWSTETDNFATASFSSGDLFAVACVFATYFE